MSTKLSPAPLESPPHPGPASAPRRPGRWAGRLVGTPPEAALTILRVTLGVVMFAHAAQKVFGWFGGPGLGATMGQFTSKMGLPFPVAVLVILAEFLGSIGLVVGYLGRIAAFGIFAVMVGAIGLVHAGNGFFMNWHGTGRGEGFEYHLLAIAMALAIMIRGSGALSIDSWITRTREWSKPPDSSRAGR